KSKSSATAASKPKQVETRAATQPKPDADQPSAAPADGKAAAGDAAVDSKTPSTPKTPRKRATQSDTQAGANAAVESADKSQAANTNTSASKGKTAAPKPAAAN